MQDSARERKRLTGWFSETGGATGVVGSACAATWASRDFNRCLLAAGAGARLAWRRLLGLGSTGAVAAPRASTTNGFHYRNAIQVIVCYIRR